MIRNIALRARAEGGRAPRPKHWRTDGVTGVLCDVTMIGLGGGAIHCTCQRLRRNLLG